MRRYYKDGVEEEEEYRTGSEGEVRKVRKMEVGGRRMKVICTQDMISIDEWTHTQSEMNERGGN